MKIANIAGIGMAAAAVLLGAPGVPNAGTTQLVVTARAGNPSAGDLIVQQGKNPARVVGFERLAGDLAHMQLFVLLDDSTSSASLGTHLPELKSFLGSLPETTEVAVGYMRNGTFALAQAFTTDHPKAAAALRLPAAMPGINGSPYFALSELSNHWPSKEPAGRRAVLMLTDGVDRYYQTADMDDPYVNDSIHCALKQGVMVYSIYLRGAGLYGRGSWATTFAQSRLIQVSQETGGYAYFEGLADPVTIAPFLTDLENRFANQYRLTLAPLPEKGVQPVKVRPETPAVKVDSPTYIYSR
jgi:hypothetical protein